jgi:hypothetical protein
VIIVPRRRPQDSGYDSDAANYIARVEAADGQSIETAWKDLVNTLFLGLKAGGYLEKMQSACLLAGPRIMTTLVPLLPTMPTPVRAGTLGSFTYNRKTGISGAGAGYINTNLNDSAMGLNDVHLAVHTSSGVPGMGVLASNGTTISNGFVRNRTSAAAGHAGGAGFFATARNNSANYIINSGGSDTTVTAASTTRENLLHFILCRNANNSPTIFTTASHTFYSIGNGVDFSLSGLRTTYLNNYYIPLQGLTLT